MASFSKRTSNDEKGREGQRLSICIDVAPPPCLSCFITSFAPSWLGFPSVKDVNQSLCDDGLVETDKIGSGNFYWSFVSSRQVRLKNRVAEAEASLER